MEQLGVCLFFPSIIQQRQPVGLLLSAPLQAGYIFQFLPNRSRLFLNHIHSTTTSFTVTL